MIITHFNEGIIYQFNGLHYDLQRNTFFLRNVHKIYIYRLNGINVMIKLMVCLFIKEKIPQYLFIRS